jgi:hypothetical protein
LRNWISLRFALGGLISSIWFTSLLMALKSSSVAATTRALASGSAEIATASTVLPARRAACCDCWYSLDTMSATFTASAFFSGRM